MSIEWDSLILGGNELNTASSCGCSAYCYAQNLPFFPRWCLKPPPVLAAETHGGTGRLSGLDKCWDGSPARSHQSQYWLGSVVVYLCWCDRLPLCKTSIPSAEPFNTKQFLSLVELLLAAASCYCVFGIDVFSLAAFSAEYISLPNVLCQVLSSE